MSNPTTPAEWAGVFVRLGIAVVPLIPRTKIPEGGVGWQDKAILDESELPHGIPEGSNLGVLLGHPSGCLVDLDLDCPEAIRLAPNLAPVTGLTWGKPSTGIGHYLYRISPEPETTVNRDYLSWVPNGKPEKLVEIRYKGRQTMAPGSTHDETGEIIGGGRTGEPGTITLEQTRKFAGTLAAIAQLSRVWPVSGTRDDFAVAILGGLVHHGLPEDQARQIVTLAAMLAGDEENMKRGSSADRAASRRESGENLRGFTWIEDTYGLPAFGSWLRKCLDLTSEQPVGGHGTISRAERAERASTTTTVCLPNADTRTTRPRVELIEPPYPGFPTDFLPPVLRELCLAVSESSNVDPALVALPALAGAATLVGNAYAIQMNPSWVEPCILWTMAVCESGSRKSPAFRAALTYHRGEQNRMATARRLAEEADQEAREEWRNTPAADRGERPVRTVRDELLITSDSTMEGLVRYLAENPKGIGNISDEIDIFFQRLTQYTTSNNVAHYLSMYGGEPVTVTRADRTRSLIHIPHATVSVSGTIQPGVLIGAMTNKNVLSGLLGRFLGSMPDSRLNLFQFNATHEDEIDEWEEICRRLHQLQGFDGEPRIVSVESLALDYYARWHNMHAHRIRDSLQTVVRTADNKLWGNVCRLALVDHLICCVLERTDPNRPVGMESIRRAVGLGEYFHAEHARMYAWLLQRDPAVLPDLAERILRWFRQRPGIESATLRDLQQSVRNPGQRKIPSEEFDIAFTALASNGFATISEQRVAGGRQVVLRILPQPPES
jgi:hypothetical protein